MSTVLLCLCGCPKPAHKLGKRVCTRCGTCDAFELDGEVPAAEIAPGVPVAVPSEHLRVADRREVVVPVEAGRVYEITAHLGESTSAALHRVEAERDQLRARVDQLVAETERLRNEREQIGETRLDAAVAGLRTAADVLVVFEMHACETCGARYGKPYDDHPCGRLTPVTVTVTRKEPHA